MYNQRHLALFLRKNQWKRKLSSKLRKVIMFRNLSVSNSQ